jgi:hypothetical protein
VRESAAAAAQARRHLGDEEGAGHVGKRCVCVCWGGARMKGHRAPGCGLTACVLIALVGFRRTWQQWTSSCSRSRSNSVLLPRAYHRPDLRRPERFARCSCHSQVVAWCPQSGWVQDVPGGMCF